MSSGARHIAMVEAPGREIAEAAARALPSGVHATVTEGVVELRSMDLDPEALRRVWKAAFATELDLLRGAADRAEHMRLLVG